MSRSRAYRSPDYRIAKLQERMIKAGHQVKRTWVIELFKYLEGYINDLSHRSKQPVATFAGLEFEIAEQVLQEDLIEAGPTAPDVSLDEVLKKEEPPDQTYEDLEDSILKNLLAKL